MIFNKTKSFKKRAEELLKSVNFNNKRVDTWTELEKKLKDRAEAACDKETKIDYGRRLIKHLEKYRDDEIEVVKVWGLYTYFKEDSKLSKEEIEKMVYLNLDIPYN
jgi:predicted metal-dependent phosphotriesterase family hydrolase